ncbi:MAG TPA: DNA polymerase Y family protein [Terriglobales bacterium]|nr:DNA polymerase Y family protein [Terriglobales bacterium]
MKSFTPDRLACVDLPAFPLQLLLRRHPDWAGDPAAVVAEDKPQGLVLWVNEKARQQGVLPGLRYAVAFSLATTLRAGEVSPAESKKVVAELTSRLMRFAPEVEPSSQESGVFWLNGAGLQHIYASAQQWACAIHEDLRSQGFTINLAVGFTRFGSYAVAKAREGITVFRDPTEEKGAARDVPLDRLNIEPAFRDMLFKLGIKTVGGLLTLPPGGLRERFGKKAHRLYRMATGDLWTPLEPQAPEEPVRQKYILDDAESDTTRLLFLIKQLLHPLLVTLAARHQALVALWLSLLIDHGDWLKEPLRPATPTLDAAQILDLVRLRLESLQLAAGVIEIELSAESCAATSEQLRLFVEKPTRDLDAANRALARLRAEFGDDSVVYAKLTEGHLPEARFTWKPLSRVNLPRNDWDTLNGMHPSTEFILSTAEGLRAGSAERLNDNFQNVLVRRFAAKPISLASGPYHSHEDGWLIVGPRHGIIDKLIGPYVVTGGWWNREIQREYYYAETRAGDLLWLYFDRMRRRWFWQGAVE